MSDIVARLSNGHPAAERLAGALFDLFGASVGTRGRDAAGAGGSDAAFDRIDIESGRSVRWLHRHETGGFRRVRAGDRGARRVCAGASDSRWRSPRAERVAASARRRAMQRADALIDAYASAGFTKIHLDTSMPCADDPERLSDAIVASRAARLCAVAEAAVKREGLSVAPVYVIGTEVPVPGGAAEELEAVEPTSREAALETARVHREAWRASGLDDAWPRVIALVVQPGVEFDHTKVIDYRPERATNLKSALDDLPGMVYEAHSTDYQTARSTERASPRWLSHPESRPGRDVRVARGAFRTRRHRSATDRRIATLESARGGRARDAREAPVIGRSITTATRSSSACCAPTAIAIACATTGPMTQSARRQRGCSTICRRCGFRRIC